MHTRLLTFALSMALASGCASVKVVDCEHRNWIGRCDSVGFEFYPAKPYLLIEPGEKGPVAKLVALPDVSSPRAIRHRAGWGTLDFNLALENGMLKSFGSKLDSKGPETITAVGSAVPSVLGALTTGGLIGAAEAGDGALKLARKPVADQAALVQEVILALSRPGQASLEGIANRLVKPKNDVINAASITVKDGADVAERIEDSNKLIRNALPGFTTAISELTDYLARLPEAASDSYDVAVSAKQTLERVVAALSRIAGSGSAIALYEIGAGAAGELQLRPVTIP